MSDTAQSPIDISGILSSIQDTIGSFGSAAVNLMNSNKASDATTAMDSQAAVVKSQADQQANSIQQAAAQKTKAQDQLIVAQTGTDASDPNSTIYKYNEQNKKDLSDILNVQNILAEHAKISWWSDPLGSIVNSFTKPFYENEAGQLATNVTARQGLIQQQQDIVSKEFGINTTVNAAASNDLTAAQNASTAALAKQYQAGAERENNAFKLQSISVLDANTADQLDSKVKANDIVAQQWQEQFGLNTSARQTQLAQAEVSLDQTRSGVLGGESSLSDLRTSLLQGKTGSAATTIQNLPESQLLQEYKIETAAGVINDPVNKQNQLISNATQANQAANIISQFTSASGLPDTPIAVLNKMAPAQRDAILKAGTNLLTSGSYGSGAGDVWGAVSNLRDAGAPVSPAMSAVMKMIDETATNSATDWQTLNPQIGGGFKDLSKEMQTGVLNNGLMTKFSSDLKNIPLDNSVYQPDTISTLSKIPALQGFSLMKDLNGISGGNPLYKVQANDVFNLAANELTKNPGALPQMTQEITTLYSAMSNNINSTRKLPQLGIQPLSPGTTGFKQLLSETAPEGTGGSIVDMTNPSQVRNALMRKMISPVSKGFSSFFNNLGNAFEGLSN